MKDDVIKSGDFSEDILLLGGPPSATTVLAEDNLDSDYLPDEIELRPGEDPLGRDNAKFYKILNKRVNAFKIIIKVGSLFYRKTDGPSDYEGSTAPKVGKGDLKAAEIIYRIDYRPYFGNEQKNKEFFPRDDDGIVQQDEDHVITETIFGKLSQGYLRETLITIDYDEYKEDMEHPDFLGWSIAVYRETLDSVRSSLSNTTYVDNIVEIFDEKYCYPNTAYVRGRFTADSFQAVPKRNYMARGIKVKLPNNYNPILHTYGADRGGTISRTPIDPDGKAGGDPLLEEGWDEDGNTLGPMNEVWDGDWKRKPDGSLARQWTNNPAWVYYDLVTNPRYGLGKYVESSQIDKWNLFEIAKYCDGMVPNGKENPDGSEAFEPRLQCDLSITNEDDAYKVLQSLASSFRGMTCYSHGQISATHDAPQDATYTFTNANVVDGTFNYSSSARKARHTIALVRFNDRDDSYKPAIEYVEDAEGVKKYGIRTKDITAFGTTSKSQAQRLGRYLIGTERMETQNVMFTAGIEASYLRPGDVIEISDYTRPTYKELSARKRGGRTIRPIEIMSGSVAGSDGVNYTGRFFFDSSISGFVHDIGIDSSATMQLNILTPPSYVDPLNTTVNDSTDAADYIRRPAVQEVNFTQADVTETGFYGIGSGIETRSYIDITGDYINKVNLIDTENFNVTGFTGLLYDIDANKILVGTEYTGFQEEPPQDFIWAVEYTGANLDYAPDLERYRIIGVKQQEDFKFQINALQNNRDKYLYVDEAIEPDEPVVLNFPDPPQHFFATTVGIYGTHAKELKYGFSPPDDTDDLDGYLAFVKVGSDFDDTDDYTEDPHDKHPNNVYFKEFLPAGKHAGAFLPSNNSTYYFRIYAINKHGLSTSKAAHLAGNIDVFGVNLLLDLQVQSLCLIGDQQDNLAGRKDGDSEFTSSDVRLNWQAGFLSDSLQKYAIPNDFYWRVSYRYPDKFYWSPTPPANILHESTGINKGIYEDVLTIGVNTDIAMPGHIDNEYTPFRQLDVVVEAIDKEGNSSAGGQVTWVDGDCTVDSDYSNHQGFDMLFVNNPHPSGVRLTDRFGTIEGDFAETCASPAANHFCTDQWLEDDGTLNLVIERDTKSFVTGLNDLVQGAFLVSKKFIDPVEVVTYLDNWIADDTKPTVEQTNKLADNVFLIFSEGVSDAEDYRFFVTTPFTDITAEDALADDHEADALTEVHINVAFVDHFLNRAVNYRQTKKDILKKLDWSENCIKVGPRNAFLKGSVTYRAWIIMNVNWDSDDTLDWQGANIQTLTYADYEGCYYVRKGRAKGGKGDGTSYSTTTIQANRRSRYVQFRSPLPTHKYELVILFSDNPHKFRTGAPIPVYGGTAHPTLQISEKTKDGFRIFDTSCGGFGQGNRPTKGAYFIGVLLGDVNLQVGGDLGKTNADSVWDYVFDVGSDGGSTVKTEYGTFNL
jgi:hypothetical protein